MPEHMTDSSGRELVERLRSPLPVCPFADGAPPHSLEPEDPCPVCGGLGTLGAPDKCRGADTRVMAEAASLITTLLTRVEALEEANAELVRELTIQRIDLLARGYSPTDEEVARIDEVLARSALEEPKG